MFRFKTLTMAIHSLLISQIGMHLTDSGYIIASS